MRHENPWPNGASSEDGMYRILSIGINRSGIDAGEIDYSINVGAVDRLTQTGRVGQLIEMIDALKNSGTIQDALRKQALIDQLGMQP